MERFCTGEESRSNFQFGTIFCNTYNLPQLIGKNNQEWKPSHFDWACLVQQTKTLRPFHYFASTLIRLNPKLSGLKAYGTDGEPELIKAFSMCFPKAIHLRCTNHMRQNIKEKLRELNIPQHVSKETLADIFGSRNATHFEVGLADAQSEMIFTRSLEQVKAKWNNLEMSCSTSSMPPQFHT